MATNRHFNEGMATSSVPIWTNSAAAAPPRFVDILRRPENSVGTVAIAAGLPCGFTLAAHHGPASEFTRGTTQEVLVVAQRNVSASSVRFDLGWGWREHFFHDDRPVYVVPPDAPAKWRLDGESRCIYFAVDAAPLARLLDELGVRDPAGCLWTLAARGFEESLVHDMIGRLWREASVGEACLSLLVDSYRVAIVHALARRASTLREPGERARNGLSRLQLRQVLSYIDAHLGDALTVAEIAEIAGVSGFHFSRLFRLATGHTPHAFVTSRRLERAAELLRQGDETIAAVARKLGFSSSSHFGHVFARRMGCSPLQYRVSSRR